MVVSFPPGSHTPAPAYAGCDGSQPTATPHPASALGRSCDRGRHHRGTRDRHGTRRRSRQVAGAASPGRSVPGRWRADRYRPQSLYLDCRGSGSPTVILEAGRAATAGPGARSTTPSPRRPGRAPTTGPGAVGATPARGTPSPTPPRTCAPCSTPRARPDPTSSSATPWVARMVVSSRTPIARTWPGSCSSTPSTPISNRPGSTLCSEPFAANTTSPRRPARPCLAGRRPRLGRERGPAPGERAGGPADRGPRRSALRAATRRGDQHAHRRRLAKRVRVTLTWPCDAHDGVGRRSQHPDRPPGPRHRGHPSPDRAGSLTGRRRCPASSIIRAWHRQVSTVLRAPAPAR